MKWLWIECQVQMPISEDDAKPFEVDLNFEDRTPGGGSK